MVRLYQQFQTIPQGQTIPQPILGILPAASLHLRKGIMPQHGYPSFSFSPKEPLLRHASTHLQPFLPIEQDQHDSNQHQNLHPRNTPILRIFLPLLRSSIVFRRRLMNMASSFNNSSPLLRRKFILLLI